MEIRRSVSSAAMVEAAVTEVTAMAKITAVAKVTVGEITVMEPVVTEVSAVRSEFVMVEEGSTPTPVLRRSRFQIQYRRTVRRRPKKSQAPDTSPGRQRLAPHTRPKDHRQARTPPEDCSV